MKLIQVEDGCAIRRLVSHAVIFPAKACGEGQGGCRLPLILKIRHVERTPQSMATPWSDEADSCQLSVYERLISSTVVRKTKDIVCRLSLVESDPADFHAHLEVVSAPSPRQVINYPEGCANFDVSGVVVKSDECIRANREWQSAGLGVMKGGAIDIGLGFIK